MTLSIAIPVAVRRFLRHFPAPTMFMIVSSAIAVSITTSTSCAQSGPAVTVSGKIVVSGTCRNCGLVLDRVAQVGGPFVEVADFGDIAEDVQGRFFILDDLSPNRAALPVYNKSGERVALVGRRGEGPGEFHVPHYVTVARDSIYVYDSRLRRISVFDSTLRFRRMFSVDVRAWRMLMFPNGQMLINGPRNNRESAGAPFHVLSSSDGQWIASYPGAGGRFRRDEQYYMNRRVSVASDSTFWAALRKSYAVELWNLDGRRVAEVERKVDWFSPQMSRLTFVPGVRPTPEMRDIWFDGVDRLWILIRVADNRWADQFVPGRPAELAFNGNLTAYFDSIVEVIDLRLKRVVAHHRFDEYIACISQQGRLGVYKELDDGTPIIEIWSARTTSS